MAARVSKTDVLNRLEMRFDYQSARNVLNNWRKSTGSREDGDLEVTDVAALADYLEEEHENVADVAARASRSKLRPAFVVPSRHVLPPRARSWRRGGGSRAPSTDLQLSVLRCLRVSRPAPSRLRFERVSDARSGVSSRLRGERWRLTCAQASGYCATRACTA